MRLRHLRTERLAVEIIGRVGGDLIIGSHDLMGPYGAKSALGSCSLWETIDYRKLKQ
jgi:hypothetical protein